MKTFLLNYGGLLICDGISVWNLSPLWSAQSLFTFYPDRLHKTEPKHQTEKMEGLVVAWRIKSNLLSRQHLPTSVHLLHPSILPLPAYLSQHSMTSSTKKPLTTPPPSSTISVSPHVPGTRSEPCSPFINLSLSLSSFLFVWRLLCKGWKIWNSWTSYSRSHFSSLNLTVRSCVSGVCAFRLWPSTTTNLWPATHSLVMHQVAARALNTSLLIRGMRCRQPGSLWERGEVSCTEVCFLLSHVTGRLGGYPTWSGH